MKLFRKKEFIDTCPCQYCIDKRRQQMKHYIPSHHYRMDGLVFLLSVIVIMIIGIIIVVAIH